MAVTTSKPSSSRLTRIKARETSLSSTTKTRPNGASMIRSLAGTVGLRPWLLPQAPVAQGIEHRPPEPGAQVRILPGAPNVSMRNGQNCRHRRWSDRFCPCCDELGKADQIGWLDGRSTAVHEEHHVAPEDDAAAGLPGWSGREPDRDRLLADVGGGERTHSAGHRREYDTDLDVHRAVRRTGVGKHQRGTAHSGAVGGSEDRHLGALQTQAVELRRRTRHALGQQFGRRHARVSTVIGRPWRGVRWLQDDLADIVDGQRAHLVSTAATATT